jgi:hypothetical protein
MSAGEPPSRGKVAGTWRASSKPVSVTNDSHLLQMPAPPLSSPTLKGPASGQDRRRGSTRRPRACAGEDDAARG